MFRRVSKITSAIKNVKNPAEKIKGRNICMVNEVAQDTSGRGGNERYNAHKSKIPHKTAVAVEKYKMRKKTRLFFIILYRFFVFQTIFSFFTVQAENAVRLLKKEKGFFPTKNGI